MHMKRTQTALIILDDERMRDGIRALRRKCRHLRLVHEQAGDPPLRRHTAGFEGLARIVVGQQLSIASAQAIWGRLQLVVRPMQPQAFLAASDAELRAAGLSQGKVKTLRAVSAAVIAGLDLDRLAQAPETDVHDALTALPGIGPWSADIYLLFCLGRADAFAAGDLALQIAARAAMGLSERPSAVELLSIAERWRPWRGVAAHLLWAYYKIADRALLAPKNA
jgi:DNA-3-methyladenine glycosylase II